MSSDPVFASTDLADHIDEAEARLAAALGGVAAAWRPGIAFVEPIGGGMAVFSAPCSSRFRPARSPRRAPSDRASASFTAASCS